MCLARPLSRCSILITGVSERSLLLRINPTRQLQRWLQLLAVVNRDKTMHNERPCANLISHITISICSDLLGGPEPITLPESRAPDTLHPQSTYSCSRRQVWCNSVPTSESAVCSGGGVGDSRLVDQKQPIFSKSRARTFSQMLCAIRLTNCCKGSKES